MKPKKFKEFEQVVLTDGFWFSGSGLLNDMFASSGFSVPKNIRLEEFLALESQFSWPHAIVGNYNFTNRLKLFVRISLKIFRRIPINILQQTFLYKIYLAKRKRTNKLHEPTSVNRSVWSLVVNLLFTAFVQTFNEKSFFVWLDLKFRFFSGQNTKILLDNGIPKDHQLIRWLFRSDNVTAFFVYRHPRLQFAQISEYRRITGQETLNYSEFLETLLTQYREVSKILELKCRIYMVSCDQILDDSSYRKRFEEQLRSHKILETLRYDFELSARNNEELKILKDSKSYSKVSLRQEKEVISFHKVFENHFLSFAKSD